jgi:hypothetical protein
MGKGEESRSVKKDGVFSVFNLPTYANYTIEWKFTGSSGTLNSGTTWRIFTPYIWACNNTDTGLSCSNSYWSGTTTKTNTFPFKGEGVMTQCKVTSLKQCGIGDYRTKCYKWEENEIKIKGNNLGGSISGEC